MTKKKSYQHDRKGPPTVRPWHTLNPRRDGSPCVLKRKFGYVKTRHQNLADAEHLLAEVKARPVGARHPQAIDNLTAAVRNHRAWLMFSIQTLKEHCRFAVARFDGSLEEVRPLVDRNGNRRKWGQTRSPQKAKETRRLVNYYLSQLPPYIACCAVSAGTSDQNEAMKLLMQIATPVVEKVKRESGREPDEAEALAWKYLFEKTAHKFDPSSAQSNMAAFNTFFTYGAKRATQKRTKNDAGPGEVKINGRFVQRGSLHSRDEESDSAMFHPGTYDEDPVTRAAVANALSKLTDEERQFAVMRFVESMSLRQIAAENGISTHVARATEKAVGEKLRDLLCDFVEA